MDCRGVEGQRLGGKPFSSHARFELGLVVGLDFDWLDGVDDCDVPLGGSEEIQREKGEETKGRGGSCTHDVHTIARQSDEEGILN